MKIGIIGGGHVGLVTGLVFAERGCSVTCLERSPDVRKSLEAGQATIYEPGIDERLTRYTKDGSFRLSAPDSDSLSGSDIVFICVNTPLGANGIDFSQLKDAVQTIGGFLKSSTNYPVVVVKSTVLPGTTSGWVREDLERISGRSYGKDFGLAANPEFLREGKAVQDFMNADRIVIGTEDPQSAAILSKAYSDWNCEKLTVSADTAEFIKYYNNILLALLISFSNEMASIARQNASVDYREVLKGVFLDRRLSPELPDGRRISPGILPYLLPGPGFGGSCLPKDLGAFIHYAGASGLEASILRAVQNVNDSQAAEVLNMLENRISRLDGKTVLVLGISHKPDTDDARASSALRIAELLLARGARVILHDPAASEKADYLVGAHENAQLARSWESGVDEADVIILATAWEDYRALAGENMQPRLDGRIILDTRYMFKPEDFEQGTYYTI